MPTNHPLLKLKQGETVSVKLLFDDFKNGTHNGSPWWLYGVEVDGQRHNWFPDELSHTTIQSKRLKKGAILAVTGGEKNTFIIDGGEGAAQAPESASMNVSRVEKMLERIGKLASETNDNVISIAETMTQIQEKLNENNNPF